MPVDKTESKVMELIRNLLARAASTDSEHERELCLQRANKLMNQHAIDQAMLDMARTTFEKRKAVKMRFQIFMNANNVDYAPTMCTVLDQVARTNRCRIAFLIGYEDAVVVGMAEDVEWVQMLWMNILFDYVAKINPRWSTTESIGENVTRLKEAGYKWQAIWRFGHEADPLAVPEAEYDPQKCRYLMVEYKKHLRSIGREPFATQRFEAYRKSFTDGYVSRICVRLEQMRAANTEQADAVPGSAVALRSMDDEINQEFYKQFPSMRPRTREELDAELRDAERRDQEFLDSLAPSVRAEVLKERESKRRQAIKDNDKYWAQYERQRNRLFDSTGRQAGASAGDQVSLVKSGPAAGGASERKALG